MAKWYAQGITEVRHADSDSVLALVTIFTLDGSTMLMDEFVGWILLTCSGTLGNSMIGSKLKSQRNIIHEDLSNSLKQEFECYVVEHIM